MEKVLVTGGAGFIGSYLIDELLKREKEVIVFDNGFRSGYTNLPKSDNNITLVKGDVTDSDDWKKIPKDVDFVFHLAAINGTRYFYEIPEKVIQVNVRGTLNFFDWIISSNTKRFFFASSSEVYGFPKIFPTPESEPLVVPDPKNPRFSYSSSKIIGETMAINFSKNYGLDYTIARFHNVYGPKMGFEHVIPEFIRKCVKKEEFTIQGDGNESRCFCYITDAVEGMILTSEKKEGANEIFNIGTTDETTINELVKLLEEIHGEKINPKYTFFKNAGTKKRMPDINKISKIGYVPKISLKKGLKITYDWYSDYYNNCS